MFLGIVFFVGLLALRNYLILQTTGGSETVTPSAAPSDGITGPSGGGTLSGATGSSGASLPNLPQSSAQIPQTQSSFPAATGNSLPQPAAGTDPTTLQHTSTTGGRSDIEQVSAITSSQQQAYTGDDIAFSITIKNTASYKKFVRQLCWESSEGNFGCSPGFNLDPGQVFSISNSGRFQSSGTKSVWVTWTQDNTNFYTPVNSNAASVRIL